MYSHPMCT